MSKITYALGVPIEWSDEDEETPTNNLQPMVQQQRDGGNRRGGQNRGGGSGGRSSEELDYDLTKEKDGQKITKTFNQSSSSTCNQNGLEKQRDNKLEENHLESQAQSSSADAQKCQKPSSEARVKPHSQNQPPPRCPSKIVKADIVQHGTGEVLRRGVKMEFEIGKFYSNNDVILAQMADAALEQSNLKKKGFQWCQIGQRKEFPNGIIDVVEANWNDPIENGAFYKVVVFKQQ